MRGVVPVAETGFSHRLTAYKIVGHLSGMSYRKISGHNQVKNSFFRISNISVPCPHAQLRDRAVIKKLWTFFGPWGSASLSVTAMLDCSGKAKNQSTASERTTRLCEAMAVSTLNLRSFRWASFLPTLCQGISVVTFMT